MTEEEKKERHREAMRRYYARNKARMNAYAEQYKAEHPESVKESNGKYWSKNKETINAKRRKSGSGDALKNAENEENSE